MLFRFRELIFLCKEFHFVKTKAGKRNLICTRPENVFTAACWSAITTNSAFMRANCSPQSQLRSRLMGLAPCYHLATHCRLHCSMCVAQDIRAMLTWRRPHFLPEKRASLVWIFNIRQGLRSLPHWREHPTARADDSHATPVLPSKKFRIISRFCKTKR